MIHRRGGPILVRGPALAGTIGTEDCLSREVTSARSRSAASATLVAPRRPQAAARPSTELPLGPALRAQQAQDLRRRIGAHLDAHLTLSITDNRAVMISVHRDPRHRRYAVRLHHLFVDAPPPVVAALARYVEHNDRVASREIGAFIDERQDRIRPAEPSEPDPDPLPRPAPSAIRTAGEVYHLAEVFAELNQRYFAGRLRCRISWGREVAMGRQRRSIRLGSYCFEEDLIRVHPGLDRPWVPSFYLRWVVYHEMLHVQHRAPLVNGRRAFHTEAFAADERRFAEHDEALAWERKNVPLLLCL